MAQYYNALGGTTITGTVYLDRFFAFTKDENFDHVRADALTATFSWVTSILNADGSYYTIVGTNVQTSLDVYATGGGTDVLYGSNLNDAIFYNNGIFANGVGSTGNLQQFDLAGGDDIADFSAHGVGGLNYTKQILVRGGAGNDTIIGGTNNDELFGDDGNDFIVGNSGGDTIDGGAGDDIIYGDDTGGNIAGGQDTLRGMDGNDTLYGGVKADRLEGGNGNDTLYGGLSDDSLSGGAGDDILYGDDAGGTGGDKLFGDDGNDTLYGLGGADQLTGGAGIDRLIGGTGNDSIDGGADVDTAVFSGNRGDYLIGINPDGSYQITDTRTGSSAEGSDTVRNIEFFEFADGTIAFNQLNNPPSITSNGGGAAGAASLDENTTYVTTVTATDPDAGQTITYKIVGGADASLFSIDTNTGVVSFASAPDYENPTDADGDGIYNLVVQAFDGASGTTQALSVSINDVADGAAPVFTSNGGGATAAITVTENTTSVTTLVVADPDGPTTTFSIVGGADASLFTVDAQTGALSFVTAPNFEAPTDQGGNNVYDVIVQASDGLNGDRQKIAVTIGNVNDNAPVIVSGGSVTVNENTALATTVVATDADASSPSFAPKFSISGGVDAGLFTIDTNTGALSFINAPDYETPLDAGGNNIYDIVVRAFDGIYADEKALSVTVANINDNAPKFVSNGGGATASFQLAENNIAATTVKATDADGTVPTYRISGGLDAALFLLDATTGVLTFKSAPDFEHPEDSNLDNVYQVVVEATDGTFPTVQTINIGITDVNEVGRTITGTAGNDTISPTASVSALRTTALNDTITGLGGNDIIDGGAGVDQMDGGAGNDTYYVDTYVDDTRTFNDDLVIELAGGGSDRVNTTVSYRLAAEVENLTLLGTSSINGTGNILDNQILGNSGANILSGGGGVDTILGNDGNDSIFGDDGDDVLVGGAGQDDLHGGIGNDKLDGGVGADTLQGDDGNDTYIVDTYSDDGISTNDDTIFEFAGGGTDSVSTAISYRLAAEVENLTLTGTLAIDGTGNQSANTITGNNGANHLYGLDGNDTIAGLGGDDFIDGGAGTDNVDGGAGNDTILGGDAADTLKGSAGADIITGGLGKDTLTGGTEADTFVFNFADTTLNTNYDRIADFQGSAGDRIDLDFVAGALPAAAYVEGSVGTNNFADALALAKTLMSTTKTVAFVAGTTDGWLFWDGAGHDGLPDQAVLLSGVNSTAAFNFDLIV